MAEYIPPNDGHGRAGHLPDAANTLLELHRLLAIFLASKGFAELVEAGVRHAAELHDPILVLQEVEDSEIPRILLAVAITARVLDDANERVLNEIAGECGTLIQDLRAPENSVPLSLREACNKIIHASKIRVDIAHNERGRPYLQPFLYLYGQRNRVEWKATLDVVAFVKQYSTCVSRL
ncbi:MULTISPECIES: hypothetical protein [unclassified Paraburkholderia]|uniref:hypothetical protein n=1 Tax=unclassified Paraburkholderia TaxID=2615204 RepID=UPI0016225927|nr:MULTISPECIES: hypothetical protein [unclassified Paraburkholderia]MBB5442071.1 hypothetical protein [Paraburkholderia sp. WSM4177]MBB5482467.1 hypothetical protein [Paraburkholderia sp. WSM4180]